MPALKGLCLLPLWGAKSRSPWREEVARRLVRPIAAEWLLLKVQRSSALLTIFRPVSAWAAVHLPTLSGGNQP